MRRKSSSELKKKACLAKQRLRMGFYQNAAADKASARNPDEELAARQFIRTRICRENNLHFRSFDTAGDEKLYKKVKQLLESGENISIGMLVDQKVYETMDGVAQQRYILQLSAKFREMKDRYYEERDKAARENGELT